MASLDGLLDSVVASETAGDAIRLCVPLLYREATALPAATALLERLRLGIEDDAGVSSILHAVRSHAPPHPSIAEQLLQLLPLAASPAAAAAVVAAVPHAAGGAPADVERVVAAYKRFLAEDRSLLVPIIGGLQELPLPPRARVEAAALAADALALVAEEDVPTVVCSLLHSARAKARAAVVACVRRECGGLRHRTLAVLVDVLANGMAVGDALPRAFLDAIEAAAAAAAPAAAAPAAMPAGGATVAREDGGSSNGSALGAIDAMALLLLLQPRHARIAERTLLVLTRHPASLPLPALWAFCRHAGDPQWARLLSPLVELALW
ncbi:unnamed protein product, partial [Phaeothamnion confervicola]